MSSSARIDELRQKFDDNPRRYFAPLANEYRKAGDLDQAIFICQEYLPQQPGHMSGHIVYGQALFEAKRMDEARAVFETALTLDPENLIALRHLGDIARGAGDSSDARIWYTRGLDADPRNVEMGALLASLPLEVSATSAVIGVAVPESPAPMAAAAAELAPPIGLPISWLDEELGSPQAAVPTPAEPMPSIATPEATQMIEIPEMDTRTSAPTPVATQPAISPFAPPTASAAPASPTPPTSAFGIDLEFTAFGSSATPTEQHEAIDGLQNHMHDDAPATASGQSDLLDDELLEFEPGLPVGTREPTPVSTTPVSFQTPISLPSLDEPEPSDVSDPTAVSDPSEFSEPSHRAEPSDLSQASEASPASDTSDASEGSDVSEAVVVAVASDEPDPRPASVEDVTPSPESAAATDAGGEEGEVTPFVTETMAQLYLSQGHREAALEIYAQLIEQRPDDDALRARFSAVESPDVTAVSGDDDSQPTIREFLQQLFGGYAAAAPHTEGNPDEWSTLAESQDATPVEAAVESPVEEAAEAPDEPNLEVSGAAAMESPVASMNGQAGPDSTADGAPSSLDALFEFAPAAETDRAAAQLLSDAFNAEEAEGASLHGMPAHLASVELSLDSVFRAEAAPRADRRGDTSTAPAGAFALDQFFSGGGAQPPATTSADTAPHPEMPEDDVEQFNSWLTGLKKT